MFINTKLTLRSALMCAIRFQTQCHRAEDCNRTQDWTDVIPVGPEQRNVCQSIKRHGEDEEERMASKARQRLSGSRNVIVEPLSFHVSILSPPIRQYPHRPIYMYNVPFHTSEIQRSLHNKYSAALTHPCCRQSLL